MKLTSLDKKIIKLLDWLFNGMTTNNKSKTNKKCRQ